MEIIQYTTWTAYLENFYYIILLDWEIKRDLLITINFGMHLEEQFYF